MPREHDAISTPAAVPASGPDAFRNRWEPPTVELVCLACEISAYAPDGDIPLF